MVYYKGAVTYKELQEKISIAEIINLKNNAERINNDILKEQNKIRKK